MTVRIELSEDDLKRLVIAEIERQTGQTDIELSQVVIEVKSKQNYKSEWENAAFRAAYFAVK